MVLNFYQKHKEKYEESNPELSTGLQNNAMLATSYFYQTEHFTLSLFFRGKEFKN
jgi:hypothetical protein